MVETIVWKKGKVYILDQRKLPHRKVFIECRDYRRVASCIEKMAIRGAPAIGIAAGMGLALGAKSIRARSKEQYFKKLTNIADRLKKTRPTGANLFWVIERLLSIARTNRDRSLEEINRLLEEEAVEILREDIEMNMEIGRKGAELIRGPANILTHCNAGSLATGGYGTALGVIRTAFKQRKVKKVFIDETRPALQGARLTAWELVEEGIPAVLITDNMAGYLMQRGLIDYVIVGADRVAANGDVANKIGTYGLAVLAKYHNIPFYVAAPSSTVDMKTSKGEDITIEERDPKEVLEVQGKAIAPKNIHALNPAFDLTPSRLVTAIITERKVIKKPDREKMKEIFL